MKKAKRGKAAKKTAAKAAKKRVAPIPKGYHEVTPYLAIQGAAEAIDFYKRAFGALELMRMPGPDGKLGHAEIRIGGSRIMLSDEYPQMDFLGPRARGGTSVHIHLYVPDADELASRAVEAGAKLLRAVEAQFYGDRTGSVQDPFGHVWHLATHVEDVPAKELERRAKEKAKS